MDVIIKQGKKLSGELKAPPSKSYGQRALAASFLVPRLDILHLGKSADELAVLEILKSCGAVLNEKGGDSLSIQNTFDFDTDIHINCEESGLCARLFLGLMMLNSGSTTISGIGSLIQRPMNSIFSVFNQLGIDYQSHQNTLPISFKGTKRAIDLIIDGSISSQYVSGILYYLVGLKHENELRLTIQGLMSTPYIDMTVDLLNQIGGKIEWVKDSLLIHPAQLKSKAEIRIEGDWSSAAFWMAAAAINGDIRISGLNPNSLQADRIMLDILKKYGARVCWESDKLRIQTDQHLPFTADLTHAPDLAPILAVLAIFSNGQSELRGVNRLIHKESNRLKGIVNWLELLDIPYTIQEDLLLINTNSRNNFSTRTIKDIEFETNGDHRMVMAASILAYYLTGGKVKGIEAVQKSYPDFFQDFEKLGGQL